MCTNSNSYYMNDYLGSITGNTNSYWSKLMHRLLEKNLPLRVFENVLEVGANVGEHIPYIQSDVKNYFVTDSRNEIITQSVQDIILGKKPPSVEKVIIQVQDCQSLSYPDEMFDRYIATCVMMHLQRPEDAFIEARRVTKRGGLISILLPNDPGLAFRLSRRILTGVLSQERKREIYELELTRAREHLLNFISLEIIMKHVFKNDAIKRRSFPFRVNSFNLNTLTIYHILKK
jgi:phosphatidylethanolamine/phosphatidyl-N-methylethanolamine N-methyltransferase